MCLGMSRGLQGNSGTKKKAVSFETAFSCFMDAASSTALSFSSPSPSSLSLRSAFPVPGVRSLLVPGYPGHPNRSLSEFVQSVPSVSVFRLSPSVFTVGSAVRIHRPRHLPRLEPLPAGRLSTSELVGAWGKAPRSNLDLLTANAILSNDTNCRQLSAS